MCACVPRYVFLFQKGCMCVYVSRVPKHSAPFIPDTHCDISALNSSKHCPHTYTILNATYLHNASLLCVLLLRIAWI